MGDSDRVSVEGGLEMNGSPVGRGSIPVAFEDLPGFCGPLRSRNVLPLRLRRSSPSIEYPVGLGIRAELPVRRASRRIAVTHHEGRQLHARS